MTGLTRVFALQDVITRASAGHQHGLEMDLGDGDGILFGRDLPATENADGQRISILETFLNAYLAASTAWSSSLIGLSSPFSWALGSQE